MISSVSRQCISVFLAVFIFVIFFLGASIMQNMSHEDMGSCPFSFASSENCFAQHDMGLLVLHHFSNIKGLFSVLLGDMASIILFVSFLLLSFLLGASLFLALCYLLWFFIQRFQKCFDIPIFYRFRHWLALHNKHFLPFHLRWVGL